MKPELVMCGGDLTEAKSKALVADQDLSEWTEYRNIVDSRWNNVTWLDIRNQNKTVSSIMLPEFALNVNHMYVSGKKEAELSFMQNRITFVDMYTITFCDN